VPLTAYNPGTPITSGPSLRSRMTPHTRHFAELILGFDGASERVMVIRCTMVGGLISIGLGVCTLCPTINVRPRTNKLGVSEFWRRQAEDWTAGQNNGGKDLHKCEDTAAHIHLQYSSSPYVFSSRWTKQRPNSFRWQNKINGSQRRFIENATG